MNHIKNVISNNLQYLLNGKKFGINQIVDDFVKHHGSEEIHSLYAVRQPIFQAFEIHLVNSLSPSFRRKNDYSKFYHTDIVINNKYLLEKSYILKVKNFSRFSKKQEYEPVELKGKLTIYDFLNNYKQKYGVHKMNTYNIQYNNCQDFVVDILNANSLLTSKIKDFIKQDTKAISGLEPHITRITDLRRHIEPIVGTPINLNYTDPTDRKPFSLQGLQQQPENPISTNA
jgi:hypothetical protein